MERKSSRSSLKQRPKSTKKVSAAMPPMRAALMPPPKAPKSNKKEEKKKDAKKAPPSKASKKASNKIQTAVNEDKLHLSSMMTYPAAVSKEISYVPDDTGYNHPVNYLLHAIVQDIAVNNDEATDYDRTLGPVHIKAYLMWALIDKVRAAGGLRGDLASSVPYFPPSLEIPKAWYRFLQYLGRYEKEGMSYYPTFSYHTEISWVDIHLSETADGFSNCEVPSSRVELLRFDATKKEYYATTKTVSAQTMSSMIYNNGAAISKLISSTGLGMPYGIPSAAALDGSFFAAIHFTGMYSSFCTADFDPVITSLWKTKTLSQYVDGFPVVKPVCYADSYLNALNVAGTGISQIQVAAQSVAWLGNRQADPIKQRGWYYNGVKLSSPIVRLTMFNPTAFKEALSITLEEFARMGTLTNGQIWALVVVCNMIVKRKLAEISYPCNGVWGPMFSIPPASVLKSPMPLPIAAFVKSLAPYICKKTGELVSFVPGGFGGTRVLTTPFNTQDAFYIASNALDTTAHIDLWFGGLTAPTSGVTLDTVTIDATWLAWTSIGNRVVWPRALLDPVMRLLYSINATSLNAGDLWVTLPRTIYAPPYIVATGSYRIYDDLDTVIQNWTITEHYAVSEIASPLPLGQGDIVMCAFVSPRLYLEGTNDTNLITVDDFPFSYEFSTTTLGLSSLVQAALRSAFTPGSSFMLDIAKSRRKIVEVEKGYTKIAAIDTQNGWSTLWNRLVDGAAQSASTIGERVTDTLGLKIDEGTRIATDYVFENGPAIVTTIAAALWTKRQAPYAVRQLMGGNSRVELLDDSMV